MIHKANPRYARPTPFFLTGDQDACETRQFPMSMAVPFDDPCVLTLRPEPPITINNNDNGCT